MTDTVAFEGFDPDLTQLLEPLAQESPAGSSLRYDPLYAQIREAREEDDATLPMGDWTRPLKKADWHAVASRSDNVLRTRSKDIQVAFWLTEAWLRLHGLPGLTAGARLLKGLLTAFWDEVHPMIEENDDHDGRISPFVWANDTLAQTLLLHVRLLPFPDLVPPFITLNDWQRALTSEFGSGTSRNSQRETAEGSIVRTSSTVSRQAILEQAGTDLPSLVRLEQQIAQAGVAWNALSKLLDMRLGMNAPSLSKVDGMLLQMHLAMRSSLHERDPRDRTTHVLSEVWSNSPNPIFQESTINPTSSDNAMSTASGLPDTRGRTTDCMVQLGNRADAYMLLELAAAYLMRTEPHSPTPYLVTRAVTWGRLSLPELMQEVLQEEGDLNRYFSMLGIKPA